MSTKVTVAAVVLYETDNPQFMIKGVTPGAGVVLADATEHLPGAIEVMLVLDPPSARAMIATFMEGRSVIESSVIPLSTVRH